ncbi:unnamed protein product, partial [Hapterophycus canaliculatus]
ARAERNASIVARKFWRKYVCAASRKVMHDGSLFFLIVGCGIIVYFLGVAGHTATPLESKQERKKQRNMRRGAWVKSPDYYYFAGVFRFLPTNQSAYCVALRSTDL